ncbi:MAG: multidrug efflux system membrane fusion protein [Desulforhopalus sp.]|jgi:multidrug efflux system membrane fusion protein
MKVIKRFVFFIPVVLGLIFVVTMVKNKPEPSRPEAKERSRAVSAITVEPMTVIPRVIGYGYVEPTDSWSAIPEVSGKVVEVHPELKRGAFFSKGDLLLRLDPVSYGLAQTRGVASVMSVEAQLIELNQQKENTRRLIAIEKEALVLTEKELERKRKLMEKGYISQSDLEQEEKNLLTQQTSVKNLQNSLALIPSQEKALLAQKDSDESSLSEMKLDIERTVIRAPFDCRISEVNIELGELAQLGTTLVKAISIAEVEIPVQLSPNQFINLLSTPFDPVEILSGGFDMDKIRQMIGVKAEVRLPMFHREAIWEGAFRRTGESVDLDTGALTIYVAVKNPYENMKPGVRPPLVPNLYCEVELQGAPREEKYVVPIRAVHSGVVYLVNGEGRLETREVVVEMVMGDFAVLGSGVSAGDTLILTDLVPAIEGMLVRPLLDLELMDRAKNYADGS